MSIVSPIYRSGKVGPVRWPSASVGKYASRPGGNLSRWSRWRARRLDQRGVLQELHPRAAEQRGDAGGQPRIANLLRQQRAQRRNPDALVDAIGGHPALGKDPIDFPRQRRRLPVADQTAQG